MPHGATEHAADLTGTEFCLPTHCVACVVNQKILVPNGLLASAVHDYSALLKAIALHIQTSTHLQRLFSTDRFSDPPARSSSSITALAGHLTVTLPTVFLISQPSSFASSWTAQRSPPVSRFPSHNILLSYCARAAFSVSALIEPNSHRAISTL